MTIGAMLFLLTKVTALFLTALLGLLTMRRASAAMRHLVCAAAMAGSLLIPVLPRISPASIPVQMPVSAQVAATATVAPASTWSALSVLLALWLSGTLILLFRTMVGYARLNSLLSGANDSGNAGNVRVVSAEVRVPFVSGLRRPLIALPLTWPAEFREAAVRHELAHVERKDLWMELLARLACAVYWFHPLVWMVAARLRIEREAACDDAVLNSGFDAPSYAEALLAAARSVTESPSLLLTRNERPLRFLGCSMINTTTLKSRTARLLDSSVPRMSTTNALTRAAVACALVLATIGVLIPARAQNSAKTPPVAAAAAGPSTSATEPARAVTEPPPTVATPSATPTAPPEQAANAASGDVYSVGGDVSSPSVLSKVDPIYPEALKDLKVSGTVVLQVVVSADGIARDITVVRSDADGLDQSAVEAVQQWRFVPGQLNGEPVAVRARIEVNFKLL